VVSMTNSGEGYWVPAESCRVELEVKRSRFIATCLPVATPEQAHAAIESVRQEMPDASHHVYAFRAGHGNSVIEGMSDDGEPSGTAGPPSLAVLRGSDLGDIVIIITRYFGGQKLGTGGLVRAYSDATRAVLEVVDTEQKVSRTRLSATMSYSLYEIARRTWESYSPEDIDEIFTADVQVALTLHTMDVEQFQEELREATSGQVNFTSADSPS